MHWANGSHYEGTFFEGEKNGNGVYRDSNQGVYNGEWHLNLMHGKGTYEKHTGETIVGSFVNNKPEGHCTITSTEGCNYEGNMVQGLKSGEGQYENSAEGEVYEGEFSNDLYDGKGLYQNETTGIIYDGHFKEGKMTLVPNFMRYIKEEKKEEEDEEQQKL